MGQPCRSLAGTRRISPNRQRQKMTLIPKKLRLFTTKPSRAPLRSPPLRHIRDPHYQAGDPYQWLLSLHSNPVKRFSRTCRAKRIAHWIAARFVRTTPPSPTAPHHHLILGTRQIALDVPRGSQSPSTIRTNSPVPSQTAFRFLVGPRWAFSTESRHFISFQTPLSSRGSNWVILVSPAGR